MNSHALWSVGLAIGLSLAQVSCLNSTQASKPNTPPAFKANDMNNGLDATVLGPDAEQCTWVASTASVPFGDQDTKHQALARTVMDARSKAMNRLLGTRLEQRYVDFEMANTLKGDAVLTERVLRATQLGRTIKEKVIRAGLVDAGECIGCLFQTSLETCIAPEPPTHDKEFTVSIRLNRSHFIDGDEVIVSVTTSRDAYIYIYGIDMQFNAEQIVPNQYAQNTRLRAGEIWTYPSDGLRANGVRATARLSPGSVISAEMIRVIASLTPLPNPITSTMSTGSIGKQVASTSDAYGKSAFLSLVRSLIASGVDWVEDAKAFSISKE
jgi:hypothetical protein